MSADAPIGDDTQGETHAVLDDDGWSGEMVLACGHGWPGECANEADAQAFLAMCIATGDSAPCATCGVMVAITGPLRKDHDA